MNQQQLGEKWVQAGRLVRWLLAGRLQVLQRGMVLIPCCLSYQAVEKQSVGQATCSLVCQTAQLQ